VPRTKVIVLTTSATPAGRPTPAGSSTRSPGRERDVLALVGLGMSNAEAGGELRRGELRRGELRLGEGAVDSYVALILGELGCANRHRAAIVAFEAGLTAR
jgi:DNA-binding NarL/FixJ family response regulator